LIRVLLTVLSLIDVPCGYGAEKYHGVVLIPEGLVESIPEFYALLQVVFVIY